MQHECDTINTSATQVLHKCYTNDMGSIRVKNFDFCNDTSKNISSHTYIYYMANERLYGDEQFHFKIYFLEISLFHAKMRLKCAQQKVNFLMEIVATNALARSRIVTRSNAVSFLIKTILCENTNIIFRKKNY